MSPSSRQTLPFYRHPGFLRSPSLSPRGLPVYAEDLALAYANASSDSSSNSLSPRRSYDPRVYSYFELSASESEDI
jgi:hypothetical protein